MPFAFGREIYGDGKADFTFRAKNMTFTLCFAAPPSGVDNPRTSKT